MNEWVVRYMLRHARRSEIADRFDCIKVFYNPSRRHSTLGYHSLIQLLQGWSTAQQERKLTA